MTFITPKPPRDRAVAHPDPDGPFVVPPTRKSRGRPSQRDRDRQLARAQQEHPELFLEGGRETIVRTDPNLSRDIVPRGEFLIPSTDEHGHAATMVFRLPPNMAYLVESIVAAREFPFLTKSDLARWSLHLGLKYLADLTKHRRVSNYHSMLTAALTLSRVRMEEVEYARDLEKMLQPVSQLIQAGHSARARRLLSELHANLSAIDDEEWRGRYLKVLYERFAELMPERPRDRKKKRQGRNRR